MTSFKLKIEEKEKSHAYMQGADAFNQFLDCPYFSDDPAYHEWWSGYEDAKFLKRLINEL